MKTKSFNLLIGMLFIALLLPIASALNGFTFFTYQMGNDVTRNYGEISYQMGIDNYLTSKKLPLQLYISYGLDPIGDWNNQHPENQIDWCAFQVREVHNYYNKKGIAINQTTTWYNTTFTAENDTVTKDSFRHFIEFNEQDRAYISFDCHFIGTQIIQTPITLSISSPTWECKACQNYNYYKAHLDEVIGEGIDADTTQLEANIKDFVKLNVNLWLIGFWIIKIIFVVGVIGLIFIIMWWVYIFIRHLIMRV